ncbi:hypothetical protein [Methylobacterium platani]|uniref:Uncharacterized protein n=2 Tax=Methylobacterium platani TaxID=427683 RepID=A0A179SEM3_9HYPH|nr:hypothetical protein [Methylobacterium platani]KMO21396.1 hypothetical protein SQ03_03325 [Methylobacterium platani JCM 14648]OAS26326.1 hypothetical protein A5481_06320 [Methylobacterium platani]
MTTLTPTREAVEKAITAMMARFDQELAANTDLQTAGLQMDLNKAFLFGSMRFIADCQDLGLKSEEVSRLLAVGISNALTSVMMTVTRGDREPAADLLLTLLDQVADAAFTRLSEGPEGKPFAAIVVPDITPTGRA